MRAIAGVVALAAAGAVVAFTAGAAEDAAPGPREPVVLRAGLCGRRPEIFAGLTPLSYRGGFHTKSLIYEPLVRIGAKGELLPGLAESWTQSADGLAWTLRLRDGIVAHDDARFGAAAVKEHVVRMIANPGNAWLGANTRIRGVETPDPRTVVITLSEPWYLPGEVGSVNPWYITAQGAFDYEGTFVKTVGTGPFRLVQEVPAKSFAYETHRGWWGGGTGVDRIEATLLPDSWRENGEVLRAVLAGEVDLVTDGEGPVIPREELGRVAARPWLRIWKSGGSSVHYLLLNTTKGPAQSRDVRRRLAAAVDRAALVRDGELGYARPSTTLFLGGHHGWPAEGRALPAEGAAPAGAVRLRLLLGPDSTPRIERHAALLRSQAAAAGIDLVVESVRTSKELRSRVEAGDYEVLLRMTQGVPYDPWISLQLFFLRVREQAERTASRGGSIWEDAQVRALVLDAERAVGDAAREKALAAVQARLDEEVPLIPLFVTDRIVVADAGIEGLVLGPNLYDLGLASARWRKP